MRMLGNIFWIIFGGFLSALGWIAAGCLWCITIVGIPIGKQCFKLCSISLNPFGKEVEYGGGAVSLLANIIWLICIGTEMAVANLIAAVLCCISIIGIPFAGQFVKIAKLWLMPFGAEIEQ